MTGVFAGFAVFAVVFQERLASGRILWTFGVQVSSTISFGAAGYTVLTVSILGWCTACTLFGTAAFFTTDSAVLAVVVVFGSALTGEGSALSNLCVAAETEGPALAAVAAMFFTQGFAEVASFGTSTGLGTERAGLTIVVVFGNTAVVDEAAPAFFFTGVAGFAVAALGCDAGTFGALCATSFFFAGGTCFALAV